LPGINHSVNSCKTLLTPYKGYSRRGDDVSVRHHCLGCNDTVGLNRTITLARRCLGPMYLRFAFRFRFNLIKQLMLARTAGTAPPAIITCDTPGLSKLSSVTAVGCYLIVPGMQLYLASAFVIANMPEPRCFSAIGDLTNFT
jgi:hypothetical protein